MTFEQFLALLGDEEEDVEIELTDDYLQSLGLVKR